MATKRELDPIDTIDDIVKHPELRVTTFFNIGPIVEKIGVHRIDQRVHIRYIDEIETVLN